MLTSTPDGALELDVLASAGASVSKVRGVHANALKVAVRAPPERGKANQEILEVLAAFFGVPRSALELRSGETARNKRVRIRGLSIDSARARIKTLD